jgi:hypothetical protein
MNPIDQLGVDDQVTIVADEEVRKSFVRDFVDDNRARGAVVSARHASRHVDAHAIVDTFPEAVGAKTGWCAFPA